MNKIKLLIFILFLSSAMLFAQQKKYVSYTTKKGETLKSIAKNYHMSKKDLMRLNPGVSKKPKENTVIIVPNKNFGKEIVANEQNKDTYYVVLPKDTLYGISRKFGLTIEALKNANPTLENGLKIGMKLTIPKPAITQVTDSINYVLHKVIKDDTVYSLTKKYAVTANDLLNLNPPLIDGLKLGMLLKIKPIEEKEELEENNIFTEKINFDKELNVIFMLPYKINKLNDSIRKVSFEKENSLLNYTTDYHLGATMAIDSLRQKGLKINVQFFDTEASDYKLQYIINKNNFTQTDVVIGPLYFDKAHWVSKRIKASVIAPIYSKKQDSISAGNLIKASPSFNVYEEKLLTYMKKSYKGENIIVVNDDKPKNQSKLWRIVNKIKAFDSIKNIEVIKPKDGYIAKEVFMKKLDTLGKNWVLLITDEVLTTYATVNNLKTYADDVDIDLFAITKGRNFDNIDNRFLGKLNFVFTTSEFLNRDDVNVKNFFKKYKETNYALPTKFAIRGFDVTYDALIRIASADSLEKGLKLGASRRLSSLFNYRKKMFGSFENIGIFLVNYTKELDSIILE
jgi:LysM repeat protein